MRPRAAVLGLLTALLLLPTLCHAEDVQEVTAGQPVPFTGVLLSPPTAIKAELEGRAYDKALEELAATQAALKAQAARIEELTTSLAAAKESARIRESALALAEERDKMRAQLEQNMVFVLEQSRKTLEDAGKSADRAAAAADRAYAALVEQQEVNRKLHRELMWTRILSVIPFAAMLIGAF